jgi:hypothetical protein
VNAVSPLVASLLVLLLLGVAGYFARQQVQALRALPRQDNLPPEDERYFRRRAWRRLLGCALLAAIAGMIAWAYVGGLVERLDAIGEANQARPDGAAPALNPEDKQFVKFFGYYWIGILLLLLVLVFVAGWDMWATRGYASRHYRRINDDRRAMLQRQLVQLRKERGLRRNGPGGGRNDEAGGD